jgi:hypothetical protein
MPKLILAAGEIPPRGDELETVLSQSNETAAVILFRWPAKPTVTHTATMDPTIAAVMRILAAACVKLAQIRAAGL